MTYLLCDKNLSTAYTNLYNFDAVVEVKAQLTNYRDSLSHSGYWAKAQPVPPLQQPTLLGLTAWACFLRSTEQPTNGKFSDLQPHHASPAIRQGKVRQGSRTKRHGKAIQNPKRAKMAGATRDRRLVKELGKVGSRAPGFRLRAFGYELWASGHGLPAPGSSLLRQKVEWLISCLLAFHRSIRMVCLRVST